MHSHLADEASAIDDPPTALPTSSTAGFGAGEDVQRNACALGSEDLVETNFSESRGSLLVR